MFKLVHLPNIAMLVKIISCLFTTLGWVTKPNILSGLWPRTLVTAKHSTLQARMCQSRVKGCKIPTQGPYCSGCLEWDPFISSASSLLKSHEPWSLSTISKSSKNFTVRNLKKDTQSCSHLQPSVCLFFFFFYLTHPQNGQEMQA
jgi:hypothetical protein